MEEQVRTTKEFFEDDGIQYDIESHDVDYYLHDSLRQPQMNELVWIHKNLLALKS